ncbi:hypothetical protein C3747_50g446c [Trypanosoma cruzi]|uniref:Uncharacterized protein n=2 Tax=Trypanosoma cruzi TaxID=5693 RepID=Q4D1N7_TRYCC|nr:hypothetical protein, conserved [Trypanosoma cruzi]PBJ69719.1 hypothetical protein BCY84_19419 [Trypanosoma cruzi cruzi]EAN86443.1 hypothetical protein, conserved [Trypanosoma cruzi]KAF8296421.1 hypothetical protein TcBrA4_0067420 [Trypanosoma cruzi]PWU91852.1 hypothetical protein C4B63_41g1149c [Trypanosoma cruzi]PWV12577.1 hypothetical protein C3747_50g446c [Trypanosoma cruzi]|eukprot:XP_808294.1 hypothetical protein [Trypanosoma cruzi strain CL Brener]
MVGLSLKIDIKFYHFREFYIYYLSKHMHIWTRRFHVLGTVFAAFLLFLSAVKRGSLAYAISAPIVGYSLAWAGDFAVEGITPTSFSYPWWSFRANMRLMKEILCGEQAL